MQEKTSIEKDWRGKLSAEELVTISWGNSGHWARAKLREGPLCCFWMNDLAQGASHRLEMMAMISTEFGQGKERPTKFFSLK